MLLFIRRVSEQAFVDSEKTHTKTTGGWLEMGKPTF